MFGKTIRKKKDGVTIRENYALYITLIVPAELRGAPITGDSYSGALMHLFVGREPNRVFEMGMALKTAGTMPVFTPNSTGNIEIKLRGMLETVIDTNDLMLAGSDPNEMDAASQITWHLLARKLPLYMVNAVPTMDLLHKVWTSCKAYEAHASIWSPEHTSLGNRVNSLAVGTFDQFQAKQEPLCINAKGLKDVQPCYVYLATYTQFWDARRLISPVFADFLSHRVSRVYMVTTDEGKQRVMTAEEILAADESKMGQGFSEIKKKVESGGYADKKMIEEKFPALEGYLSPLMKMPKRYFVDVERLLAGGTAPKEVADYLNDKYAVKIKTKKVNTVALEKQRAIEQMKKANAPATSVANFDQFKVKKMSDKEPVRKAVPVEGA